jgi:small-conductance mechanosensitive channel
MPPEPFVSRLSRLRSPNAVKRVDAQAIRQQAAEAAKRGRRRLVLLIPVIAAVIAAYSYRIELFGVDKPVRIATAVALVLIAWPFAGGLANVITGRLQRVMEPGLTGVAGFLIKLLTLALTVMASLRLAGLPLGTLALGASFTAVVFGLAAQQTLGNVLAGVVLLSARPFTIGDRVRFAGFGMDVEGTIVGHGLLYVTCADGEDHVLVPNNTALSMAVRPIREPAKVDMRARLPRDIDPEAVESIVTESVSIPTKGSPEVELEEYDGDEVVVRIKATPDSPDDGAKLAREVLGAVTAVDREHTRAAA